MAQAINRRYDVKIYTYDGDIEEDIDDPDFDFLDLELEQTIEHEGLLMDNNNENLPAIDNEFIYLVISATDTPPMREVEVVAIDRWANMRSDLSEEIELSNKGQTRMMNDTLKYYIDTLKENNGPKELIDGFEKLRKKRVKWMVEELKEARYDDDEETEDYLTMQLNDLTGGDY